MTNLDLLAGTFGDIMAEILAYKSTRGIDWSEELRRLGYQLGKFIYILDAYDDVQEDIEKNRFNPLKELYHKLSKEQFDCYVKEILMISISPKVPTAFVWRRHLAAWVAFWKRWKILPTD